MVLSILAAVFHGIAYAIYLTQVYGGGSIPNPASWTIWAFLSTLNAITFYKGSRDGLATAHFSRGQLLVLRSGCSHLAQASLLRLIQWLGRFLFSPLSLARSGISREAPFTPIWSSAAYCSFRQFRLSLASGATVTLNSRFRGGSGQPLSSLRRSTSFGAPTERNLAGGS